MNNDLSINKRILWRYVNKKINRVIHHYHVLSIITILFDELLKDLKAGKDIDIFNFGTLSLRKTKPRRYHDVMHKRVMMSRGRKMLKFSLSYQIGKKIRSYLNIDKKNTDLNE